HLQSLLTRPPTSAMLVIILIIASAAAACPFPEPPRNGRVIVTKLHKAARFAQYVCGGNFELFGPSNQTCLRDGAWHPEDAPLCVADVAVGVTAFQSTIGMEGNARLTVDGERNTCSETMLQSAPWFAVDLQGVYPVVGVKLDFPVTTAANVTLYVRVGNFSEVFKDNPVCTVFDGTILSGRSLLLVCPGGLSGRYVSLHLRDISAFSLCEFAVYSETLVVPQPEAAALRAHAQKSLRNIEGLAGFVAIGVTLTVAGVLICMCCNTRLVKECCCRGRNDPV
ncbi:unnamed protein product, partial [Ixodes persulcatus]